MKVIFSRKGSDSGKSSGRMASPILPCGCLCSIPIPYEEGVSYSQIRFGKRTLPEICGALKSDWNGFAHLDPDLRSESMDKRPTGWRAAFGQSSAAAGHLGKQGVGEGDLFLFFGWFRRTKVTDGKLKFCPKDLDGRHIVYAFVLLSMSVTLIESIWLRNRVWELDYSDLSQTALCLQGRAVNVRNGNCPKRSIRCFPIATSLITAASSDGKRGTTASVSQQRAEGRSLFLTALCIRLRTSIVLAS